ncbi:unnamed protein product [Closterium sp. NIES-65]|nr:unnamed protein product [Closterium sp. NIES-65]
MGTHTATFNIAPFAFIPPNIAQRRLCCRRRADWLIPRLCRHAGLVLVPPPPDDSAPIAAPPASRQPAVSSPSPHRESPRSSADVDEAYPDVSSLSIGLANSTIPSLEHADVEVVVPRRAGDEHEAGGSGRGGGGGEGEEGAEGGFASMDAMLQWAIGMHGHVYDPCSQHVYDPCSQHVYDPCSQHVYDPCSQHVYDPCSQHVYDPCSQHVYDPCSQHVYDPCSRSDPEALRQRAKEVAELTPAELEEKRKHIRDVVDAMRMPSPGDLMRAAIAHIAPAAAAHGGAPGEQGGGEEEHERVVGALQELAQLVEPVHAANGALLPCHATSPLLARAATPHMRRRIPSHPFPVLPSLPSLALPPALPSNTHSSVCLQHINPFRLFHCPPCLSPSTVPMHVSMADLHKLGGLAPLGVLLAHGSSQVRSMAALVVGKAAQNNRQVQHQTCVRTHPVMGTGVLQALFTRLHSPHPNPPLGEDEHARLLFALSAAIRGHVAATHWFYRHGGVALLARLLSLPSSRTQRRALFLLADLADSAGARAGGGGEGGDAEREKEGVRIAKGLKGEGDSEEANMGEKQGGEEQGEEEQGREEWLADEALMRAVVGLLGGGEGESVEGRGAVWRRSEDGSSTWDLDMVDKAAAALHSLLAASPATRRVLLACCRPELAVERVRAALQAHVGEVQRGGGRGGV